MQLATPVAIVALTSFQSKNRHKKSVSSLYASANNDIVSSPTYLVDLHEHAVVDLAQTEQLQDLAGLGVHSVDTADADDEGQLGLAGHVEAALLLGVALQADGIGLLRAGKDSNSVGATWVSKQTR